MNPIQKACLGFSEGLAVPLIEIVLSIFMSSMITVMITVQNVGKTLPSPVTVEPPISIPLMLGLFALMNIFESLVVGLKDEIYAIFYCFGAIAGLFLFSSIILSIYPGATTATLGVIGIVILGFIIKIYIFTQNAKKRDEYQYYY